MRPDQLDLEALIAEVQRETRRRRMRRSTRVVAAAIAVAIGISLLFATGTIERVGTHDVTAGRPVLRAPASAISVKRAPTLEIYRYWSGRYATPIYSHRVGVQAAPQALVPGMWASETPSVGSAAALAVQGAGSVGRNVFTGDTIYAVGNQTLSLRTRTPPGWSSGLGSVLLDVHNDVYVQIENGPGTSIFEISTRSHRVVHQYTVPGIPSHLDLVTRECT
jgi:hypothetical protein